MNLLVCIGAKYRDFTSLNAFSQDFARQCFGTLEKILFCDSLDLKSLKLELKGYEKCLILANKDFFSVFLESFKIAQSQNISQNALKISHKECEIWLIDTQEMCCAELDELQKQIKPQSEIGALYLYPLAMDAISAKTLLSGIANEFQVNLNILSDSNLEILSAINGDINGFRKVINEMFGDKIFNTFNLAQSIIALLRENNYKITTAESCTGGLIAYYLTKESGASAVFDGGVISYANHIKEAWLNVSSENLANFGAVSEAVVSDMLDGVLHLSGADFAIATSGIAGPDGGSTEKPVGTVYIGVSSKNGAKVIERLFFSGNRNYIQEQAKLYAYLLFLRIFLNSY